MGDEIRQDQRQDLRFQSKPVHKVRCHFFSNEYTESISSEIVHLNPGNTRRMEMAKEIEREQQVDVLLHDGAVTKVFCPLISGDNCMAPKNKDKRCSLK
jgi:hypothetical protein